MSEQVDDEAGRITRRAGIKLGLGGLAWAGLVGVAEARHQPPPSGLCPIAFGGSWPGTWIYYFSPNYGASPSSCPGPYFGVASSVSLRCGCGVGDCISVAGGPMLPPTKKTLPVPGKATAAVSAKIEAFSDIAHASATVAGPGAEPLDENTPVQLQLVGAKRVEERRRYLVKAHGRAFVCVELYFPAHTSVHDGMAYPDVTLRVGQELKRGPKAEDLEGKPVSKSGKYAHIKVGPAGGEEDYYVLGSKNKGDI